ncbi:MAG: alpha-L-arabinofuranosidase [Muribaculaceae bacterium]|nr:alpha-L-arabinofuranosidase [Muribaculaceae bacterium]
MKTNFLRISALALAAAMCGSGASYAETKNEMVIQTNKVGAEIQPTMYGLFFEDINYGADGGLYAEMIKNRSFEFPQNFMGWNTFGNVELKNDGPFEKNPHYVRLSDPGHRHKRTGLDNEGFFGVAFKKGEEYRFSVWARSATDAASKIRVELIDPASMGETQVMAKQDIEINSPEWKKYTVTLKPSETNAKGRLRIFLSSPNSVDLEHISLFPVDTWKGHENGLRKDLAQKLADINPGLLRFPGGCIVEGTDLETRYQWKNTVGPVENRPLNENRWEYTFPHRFFPDYFQSYGLGFFEFFQLSEEIGAEPLPVLNVGLACQYQNNAPSAHVPVDELQPYIQDALDLIEFANGDTTTTWGALRAQMGHPAPFNMKFIGIGNEQWGATYPEHLKPFITAIRAKYPDIKIVGSSGPNSEGKEFDYLWPEMKKLKADLVDEHFYRPESWFLAQGARYDNYDRKGPKVFAGEYACHGKGKKWNHFNAALLEAAFMTGLERNADVVHMATYAPLFAHVEGWQWRPDMIWFDNLESFPTSSYYVQQLYASNKGTNVLPLTMDKKPVTGAEGQNGLFASAVIDKNTGEYIVKVANTGETEQPLTLNFAGMKKGAALTSCKVITLNAPAPDAENSLENPSLISPVESTLPVDGQKLTTTIPPLTFRVYILK